MKRERLLHLHYLLADHWKAIERLLHVDPELKGIYTFNAKQMECYTEYPRKIFRISKFSSKFKSPAIYILFREKSNLYMTIWDKDYPKLLREIQRSSLCIIWKRREGFSQ